MIIYQWLCPSIGTFTTEFRQRYDFEFCFGIENLKSWLLPQTFLKYFFVGPICNSMEASLCFKSCEHHSLLKSYNGGLWKNSYRPVPWKVYAPFAVFQVRHLWRVYTVAKKKVYTISRIWLCWVLFAFLATFLT